MCIFLARHVVVIFESGHRFCLYQTPVSDEFVKTKEETPTIGIVLCKQKNETLVQITLPKDNQQIFASKYQTVLPSKEELKQLIEDRD